METAIESAEDLLQGLKNDPKQKEAQSTSMQIKQDPHSIKESAKLNLVKTPRVVS